MAVMFKDLRAYVRQCVRLSIRSSWAAANGLGGAAIAGAVVIWRGLIVLIPGDGQAIAAINWLISFILYAVVMWVLLFIVQVVFVAPFQLWRANAPLIDKRALGDALNIVFNRVRYLSSSSSSTPEEYAIWRNNLNELPNLMQTQLAGKLSPAEINILINGPSGPRLSFSGQFGLEQLDLQNYLHYLEHRVSQSIGKYS
jgi:hypothetical protein